MDIVRCVFSGGLPSGQRGLAEREGKRRVGQLNEWPSSGRSAVAEFGHPEFEFRVAAVSR